MRKTVHSKLIACYILIGIIGFLFATAGGSHFVESYLEGEVGHRLFAMSRSTSSTLITSMAIIHSCIFSPPLYSLTVPEPV